MPTPDIEELIGPATNSPRKIKNLGPLHNLLLKACPVDEDGQSSVPLLAVRLGISSSGVYKWIRRGKISGRWSKAVVLVSRGRVTIQDFVPYLK